LILSGAEPTGFWRGLVRQVETTVWTIIAPELILAWAVRQWFAARKIRDTVNGIPEGIFLKMICRQIGE